MASCEILKRHLFLRSPDATLPHQEHTCLPHSPGRGSSCPAHASRRRRLPRLKICLRGGSLFERRFDFKLLDHFFEVLFSFLALRFPCLFFFSLHRVRSL